jgi:hypothetical protein
MPKHLSIPRSMSHVFKFRANGSVSTRAKHRQKPCTSGGRKSWEGHSAAILSFADAKCGKDFAEQVVARELARELAQRALCVAQVLRRKLERAAEMRP